MLARRVQAKGDLDQEQAGSSPGTRLIASRAREGAFGETLPRSEMIWLKQYLRPGWQFLIGAGEPSVACLAWMAWMAGTSPDGSAMTMERKGSEVTRSFMANGKSGRFS